MSGAAFLDLSTTIALWLLGIAMALTVLRIILGPSLADRILGLDTITVLAIGVIGVFAVRTGLYLYVDVAVALALVGFLATAAFARYLLSHGGGGEER
jgi:multicomponent Na+:H+ antiporter subunit F